MDKARVKNFIICILFLVNAFLLVIVLESYGEERRAYLYRREALEKVLEDNGISLNSEIKLPEKIPPQISLKRDIKNELDEISALIGECKAEDLGGNIYFYSGPDGEAKFRGTGEFEILLRAGVIRKGKNPVESAVAALKKLGIEYSDASPLIENDGQNIIVTLSCSLDKTPVYNSRISFYFNSENLTLIIGNRPQSKKYSAVSSENYPDSVTVLMNFLENIRQTGEVCSKIEKLEIGYFLNSAVSGDCTLKPVWCIQTDAKPYYIDAQSGEPIKIKLSP